ncbi:PREDICTED: histone-lysine N-methyltransferase EZ3 isoform X2 [Nelumbo nucifera]|uniref:Histone-lysine N-methyltransferase EZ3 isoform X2 n=1 Tax=Nelumbo nucifera TaxID=4432 RepID=A0A1U8AC51_NELNU|nr:PREDICTED: histone-lysine N-methyltransferase EZ3 isoform X2 [Nelumbo nucifera]
MASKATESASRIKKSEEHTNETFGMLLSRISQLKKEIQNARVASIREKLERNRKTLQCHTSQLQSAALKKDFYFMEHNGSKDMLSFRAENALCKFSGSAQGSGERDCINDEEILSSTAIRLPLIEKIPPYTTWIFLDKNQRMAEDQSVLGRRQIYYDPCGSEALICSDSEEDIAEPEEEKHEFSEGEDQILWNVLQEHGVDQEVLNLLSQFIEATTTEVQERYNILMEQYHEKASKNMQDSVQGGFERSLLLEKSLSAALDSFDNLFCRRCLVFDCRLHGCSQNLVIPGEKRSYWGEHEENGKPCGDQCYLQVKGPRDLSERINTSSSPDDNITDIRTDERCKDGKGIANVSSQDDNTPEVSFGALDNDTSILGVSSHENLGKRSRHGNTAPEESTQDSSNFQSSSVKKQKKISSSNTTDVPNSDFSLSANIVHPLTGAPDENQTQTSTDCGLNESFEHTWKNITLPSSVAYDENKENIEHETNNAVEGPLTKQFPSSRAIHEDGTLNGSEWKPIEKELYLKGIEIFGKNSCLIARNLLSGLKTCIEVFTYMLKEGAAMAHQSADLPSPCLESNDKDDNENMEQEMPTRSRLFRRRGRARKLKYTWKSAGHSSSRKRIADGKHQLCKQYTPCGCQFMCGKQCPCLQEGTCCEKYCGCSKSCKNRFRGCHCAKSQCRSRQCPCFAAGRECDPDVCRNCWVSCGDGSLGQPPQRVDGYQCGNMSLLLKQQQRILLGRSDVAGWGAFIKNPVNKNDYLGEYTGELISHQEADKRGKIYDRANSSFLFDLNDQETS